MSPARMVLGFFETSGSEMRLSPRFDVRFDLLSRRLRRAAILQNTRTRGSIKCTLIPDSSNTGRKQRLIFLREQCELAPL